jgi:hypothetical protein
VEGAGLDVGNLRDGDALGAIAELDDERKSFGYLVVMSSVSASATVLAGVMRSSP